MNIFEIPDYTEHYLKFRFLFRNVGERITDLSFQFYVNKTIVKNIHGRFKSPNQRTLVLWKLNSDCKKPNMLFNKCLHPCFWFGFWFFVVFFKFYHFLKVKMQQNLLIFSHISCFPNVIFFFFFNQQTIPSIIWGLTFQNGICLQDLLLNPGVLPTDRCQELQNQFCAFCLPRSRFTTAKTTGAEVTGSPAASLPVSSPKGLLSLCFFC